MCIRDRPYLDALHRAPELVRGFLEKILAPKQERTMNCLLYTSGTVCWESCSLPQSRKTPMKQTNERLCALDVYKRQDLHAPTDIIAATNIPTYASV